MDYKGLHILVEAMSQIPEASLILVGNGEKEAELKQQIENLGMEKRTVLPGFLSDELKAAIYQFTLFTPNILKV